MYFVFKRFVRKVTNLYAKCSEHIDLPGKGKIHSITKWLLFNFMHADRGKKRKKRIPLFTAGLLFLLVGLNIVSSVQKNFVSSASASPEKIQTAWSPQNKQQKQIGIQTQNQLHPTNERQIQSKLNQQRATQNTTTAQLNKTHKALEGAYNDCTSYINSTAGETTLSIYLKNIMYPNSVTTPPAYNADTVCENALTDWQISSYDGTRYKMSDVGILTLNNDCNNTNNTTNSNDSSCSEGTTTPSCGGSIIEVYPNINSLFVQDICFERQATSNALFPCTDNSPGNPNAIANTTDWLAGNFVADDPDYNTANSDIKDNTTGMFDHTPLSRPGLFFAMQAIALALLVPSFVMIGFQLAMGLSSFRMANAMEALSRLIISLFLIIVCYSAIALIISFSNDICTAILHLHAGMPYPSSIAEFTNGLPAASNQPAPTIKFGYDLPNDFGVNNGSVTQTNDPYSFRGIIIPLGRWGCTANDFMGILTTKFATDILTYIPIVGSYISVAGKITDAVDILKNAGEFIQTILSIILAVQLLVRLVILNFYILMAPIAFSCWALPGGVGQQVVKTWFKGFLSVLSIQLLQLFFITVIPSLIPNPLPQFPTDSLHILDSFVNILPSIIVLSAVLKVPKLLGTSAGSLIASSGQMVGGAVTAVGAAAYNVV